MKSEFKENRKSNFYYAFKFLPKQTSNDLQTFYSFARLTDDIADSKKSKYEKQDEFENWKSEFELGIDGKSKLKLLNDLGKIILGYSINAIHIYEFFRGIENDINEIEIETLEDLEKYSYYVASTIGLITIEIFGYKNEKTKKFAINLGKALQLINIIRDVKFDYFDNRMYLPVEMLKKYEVDTNRFLEDKTIENTKLILKELSKKAEEYFDLAFENLEKSELKTIYPAVAMGKIYHELLRKIRRDNFDVFEKRYEIETWVKLKIVLTQILKGKFSN